MEEACLQILWWTPPWTLHPLPPQLPEQRSDRRRKRHLVLKTKDLTRVQVKIQKKTSVLKLLPVHFKYPFLGEAVPYPNWKVKVWWMRVSGALKIKVFKLRVFKLTFVQNILIIKSHGNLETAHQKVKSIILQLISKLLILTKSDHNSPIYDECQTRSA